MRFIRSRLTYANVTATLALVFAMSGSAFAARHYLITSTAQIKPTVLKRLRARTGPAGGRGAPGATGAAGSTGAQGNPGVNGASLGLLDSNESPREIPPHVERAVIASIAKVPAGRYMIVAKTLALDENAAEGVSLHCYLSVDQGFGLSDIDESVGELPKKNAEATLTMTGGYQSAAPGSVAIRCNDFGTSEIIVSESKISVIQVQGITPSTG